MASYFIVLVLSRVPSIYASPAVNTTDLCVCTTDPHQNYGWYSPPNLRGTSDILFGCLSTLFICLWVSIHLNVPAPNETRFTITRRKLKWMLYALLAPELLAFIAISQWFEARQAVSWMNSLGYRWTMTHGHFAAMGGFVVSTADGQAHFPKPGQLCDWVSTGIIEYPHVSEGVIKDKSKADGLVKAIACIQASWFLLQCIARTAQGLPLTTLEVVTVAYVISALVTYCGWWSKPLDVTVPIFVGTLPASAQSVVCSPRTDNLPIRTGWYGGIVGFLIGIFFGGLHCLAWHGIFPSQSEQLLWRISSVVITVYAPPFMALASLAALMESLAAWIMVGLAGLVYLFCRVFLIVEPFTSLRSAPGDIYQTVEWMRFIPHI